MKGIIILISAILIGCSTIPEEYHSINVREPIESYVDYEKRMEDSNHKAGYKILNENENGFHLSIVYQKSTVEMGYKEIIETQELFKEQALLEAEKRNRKIKPIEYYKLNTFTTYNQFDGVGKVFVNGDVEYKEVRVND